MYDKLDNEELLRLALDAVNGGRDAESMDLLKTLLERDPDHLFGRYLLAAQHMQVGMVDRAEAGLRDVVARAPEFAIARFQLAQVFLVKGEAQEAQAAFAPLALQDDALGAYARGLGAVAREDLATAIAELHAGLAMPQGIPALASDMQRLVERLQSATGVESAPAEPAVARFLSGYGREV